MASDPLLDLCDRIEREHCQSKYSHLCLGCGRPNAYPCSALRAARALRVLLDGHKAACKAAEEE